ncbi:hypothetical protein [Mucilaginibacter limnophilus]|uniref:hypothetical protein n=1 Tax=Mucilaginibacter limnophilus TaxID=1932778 RepID=UPI000FD97A0F|nr:hypothetical protein [Mucilaginibacter limnophilus]
MGDYTDLFFMIAPIADANYSYYTDSRQLQTVIYSAPTASRLATGLRLAPTAIHLAVIHKEKYSIFGFLRMCINTTVC